MEQAALSLSECLLAGRRYPGLTLSARRGCARWGHRAGAGEVRIKREAAAWVHARGGERGTTDRWRNFDCHQRASVHHIILVNNIVCVLRQSVRSKGCSGRKRHVATLETTDLIHASISNERSSLITSTRLAQRTTPHVRLEAIQRHASRIGLCVSLGAFCVPAENSDLHRPGAGLALMLSAAAVPISA